MDLNSQASAGGLNQAYFSNLLQMNGLSGFNGTGTGSMLPGDLGQTGTNGLNFLQQSQLLQMGGMGYNNLPQMMPF